ncbi:MAG: hypothetical protein GPJ52_16045 [Candidatus Heimdallarchaeota archaeon]|nr:hypothetical protein [Candidatus Heimdallarchaeota archaeon]
MNKEPLRPRMKYESTGPKIKDNGAELEIVCISHFFFDKSFRKSMAISKALSIQDS